MMPQSKEVIVKNFVTLMKSCDVDVLKDVLINKGVFTATEVAEMFSSPDPRHNKRLFFFNIQKKNQRAFEILIESLKETNQHNLADTLAPRISGCKPFQRPLEEDLNGNNGRAEGLSAYINSNTNCLDVNVVISKEFYDTEAHNKAVHFYSTRSKKRGKVLIINNYDYNGYYEYREGATVDNRNLRMLFDQLGGWVIDHYDNKPGQEMFDIAKQFSQDPSGKDYDICFVIIMGHGNEISNETIIFGTDRTHISVSSIQDQFNNDRCSVYRGKPKIFLYQVCRGDFVDFTIRPAVTDSIFREPANTTRTNAVQRLPNMTTNIRTKEDILIGYATLNGYKAHRDTSRGSWYIELICEKFMNHAHDHSVDDLLKLVDQGLRRRMSEKETMQTAEHNSIGFKKLYLNPGIYYENGELKYFNN